MSRFSYSKLIFGTLVLTLFARSTTAQVAQTPSSRSTGVIEIAALSLPSASMPELRGPDSAIRPAPGFIEAAPVFNPSETARPTHRFWDPENSFLFAATGAAATADFFVTHMNLSGGGRELNPLVRPLTGSTAGLATNFAVETAGVMAISYFFHRTSHHRLERLTSTVSIGTSLGAVGYGVMHR